MDGLEWLIKTSGFPSGKASLHRGGGLHLRHSRRTGESAFFYALQLIADCSQDQVNQERL